jgi:hypothetical protein
MINVAAASMPTDTPPPRQQSINDALRNDPGLDY